MIYALKVGVKPIVGVELDVEEVESGGWRVERREKAPVESGKWKVESREGKE